MHKKTILVVDDAPENLDLLAGLLKKEYRVKAAINGDIALKIAESPDPPDLILLDIVMPGKDGLEVCEILKKNRVTKHIPIIFISGKANEDDCKLGLELGCVAYLEKPLDPERLFAVLDIVLPT